MCVRASVCERALVSVCPSVSATEPLQIGFLLFSRRGKGESEQKGSISCWRLLEYTGNEPNGSASTSIQTFHLNSNPVHAYLKVGCNENSGTYF